LAISFLATASAENTVPFITFKQDVLLACEFMDFAIE
jgi:hypothetical protein